MDFARVDVKDMLAALQVRSLSFSGNEASFSCPLGHIDAHPSAGMNLQTTAWRCRSCGARGKNAISFVAVMKDIPWTKAKRAIEERYGGDLSAPIGDLVTEVERLMGREEQQQEEQRRRPSESWLEAFSVDWTSKDVICEPWAHYTLDERGFDPAVLNEWQIGYDEISDRITIPVRDEDRTLVGFKGRAYNDRNPRYLILGDAPNRTSRYGFNTYHKSEYVFGLDRLWASAYRVIVEGELNVIAMMQKYKDLPALAVAGSEFSERQRELIVTHARAAIVFFDANDAGVRGTRAVVEALMPHIPVRVVLNAPGDAAELDAEQIESLLVEAEPALLLQAKGVLPSVRM